MSQTVVKDLAGLKGFCGGLNKNAPFPQTHLFACLVAREWHCLRKIRGCGLGVGMALLEEVRHWGWALRFEKSKPGPMSLVSCCMWI